MHRLLLLLFLVAACGGPAPSARGSSPDGAATGAEAQAGSASPMDSANGSAALGTPLTEAEEAILEAEARADFERRSASMEDQESCLRKAASLPEAQRAQVEASCRRR